MTDAPERLLTRREAAARLALSEEGLRYLNRKGRGPAYIVLGHRAVYREADIDAFIRNAFHVAATATDGDGESS